MTAKYVAWSKSGHLLSGDNRTKCGFDISCDLNLNSEKDVDEETQKM